MTEKAAAEALEQLAKDFCAEESVDLWVRECFKRAAELRAQAAAAPEPECTVHMTKTAENCIAAPKPVAYAIRSKRDGSLFATDIAIVGWSIFEKRMDDLRAHPWVEMGSAEIIPLYTHPPAERVAMLESLLRAALPYIKYPRDATDAFVIAHDKMVERIRAALGE